MSVAPNLQTASGSINWQTAANWDTFTAPTTGDTATVSNSSATIDSGFVNSATLAAVFVPMTFQGTIGIAAQPVQAIITGITRSSSTATVTSAGHGYGSGDTVTIAGATQPEYNITATITVSSSSVFTYTVAGTPATPATTSTIITMQKNDYLVQPSTLVTFGQPGNNSSAPASGSPRIKWNFSTVATTITVLATTQGGSSDSNLEPLRILGTNSTNILYMIGGLVGVATTDPAEVSTFATINQSSGTLNLGAGVTWATIYQSGGNLKIQSGSSSGAVTQSKGANLQITGTGTIANLTIAGTCKCDIRKATAGDTITGTLEIDDGGTVDFSNNPSAISIATLKIVGDATIITNNANPGHVTWTTLTRTAGGTLTLK